MRICVHMHAGALGVVFGGARCVCARARVRARGQAGGRAGGRAAHILPCFINVGYEASRRLMLVLDGPDMSCGVPARYASSFRTPKRPDMQKTTCAYPFSVLPYVSFNNVPLWESFG